MPRPVLKARALGLEHQGATVCRSLDLDAVAGRVVAIVCDRAEHRAALLRCLGLRLPPTSGSLRLHGIEVSALDDRRRRLVRSDAVELVAAPDPEDERLLTGGRSGMLRPAAAGGAPVALRQRVQIAKALTSRRDLVLIDEPFADVDPEARPRVLQLVGRLRTETVSAVVVATGDIDVAGVLADRVLVLHEGEVVEDGTTPQVLGGPTHPYTRSLLAQRRPA